MPCIHIEAPGSIDSFPPSPSHRVIGNNGILRKRTRIAIVNEYSLVECMDRIILMRNRDIYPSDNLAPLSPAHRRAILK